MKTLRRILSIVLVLSLLLGLHVVPTYAAPSETDITTDDTGERELLPQEMPFTSEEASFDPKKDDILGEITSRRDEFQKEFRLASGKQMILKN